MIAIAKDNLDVSQVESWSRELARLNPAVSPLGVPADRWSWLILDAGFLVSDGIADYGARLGWTQLDLFGCDPHRPFERIDRAGLVWLLRGNRVAKITAGQATVVTMAAGQLTYRRRPMAGCIPAWELLGATRHA
jgi:hypothetical protein